MMDAAERFRLKLARAKAERDTDYALQLSVALANLAQCEEAIGQCEDFLTRLHAMLPPGHPMYQEARVLAGLCSTFTIQKPEPTATELRIV